jgi:hypothetical protein
MAQESGEELLKSQRQIQKRQRMPNRIGFGLLQKRVMIYIQCRILFLVSKSSSPKQTFQTKKWPGQVR